MNRKFLLGCYEVPGYGGASTSAYQLLQWMRRSGLEVSFLNLIDEQDAAYFRYTFGESFGNPDGLPNVYNCLLNGPLYSAHSELTDLLGRIAPDVIIGEDFISSLLMKRAFPSSPLLFYTTGSLLMKDAIERHEVRDFVSHAGTIRKTISSPVVAKNEELEAVNAADLVIAHCDMIPFLYQHYYPYQACKLYTEVIWKAEWIYGEAAVFASFKEPFEHRDIDVLFMASSWDRPQKNFPMLRNIFSRLKKTNVHIVGSCSERLPGATHHELTTHREDVFRLLGRTKTVVCPSCCDAAPGALFEAAALGCNVITSKNAGNWQLCNEQLLVGPYTAGEFVDKIRLSLSKKFEDNIDFFLNQKSYQKLIDLLAVV
jgi:hypothetical protein